MIKWSVGIPSPTDVGPKAKSSYPTDVGPKVKTTYPTDVGPKAKSSSHTERKNLPHGNFYLHPLLGRRFWISMPFHAVSRISIPWRGFGTVVDTRAWLFPETPSNICSIQCSWNSVPWESFGTTAVRRISDLIEFFAQKGIYVIYRHKETLIETLIHIHKHILIRSVKFVVMSLYVQTFLAFLLGKVKKPVVMEKKQILTHYFH